ncbi:MAG TPA: carboxypeptidase-like regulatory domain-containing protein [Bacteroidales bacterium]|nr:carboxypeptidase-like regulatory domain-containing protein [Bacteroidales bacterium]
MKKQLFYTNRLQAIKGLFEANPAVFEDVPHIAEEKAAFDGLVDELNSRLGDIVVPRTALMVELKQMRRALIDGFKPIIKMAGVVATKLSDEPMKETLKVFRKKYHRVATHELLLYLEHLLTMLEERSETAYSVGITADQISALRQQIANFVALEEATLKQLSERQGNRQEVTRLISSAGHILRTVFDPFKDYRKNTHPEFALAYARIRSSKPRKRPTVRLPEQSDISGMVSDALTGEAVAGATLMLLQYNEVMTTGNDGYYLFDELEPGTYTLSCHAKGYLVPEPISIELGTRDSQIHNFALQPAVAKT